jgi:hypothetical protein
MLAIGRPDSHALPHITSSKMRPPRCVLPPARAGSFFHPFRTLDGPGGRRLMVGQPSSGIPHGCQTKTDPTRMSGPSP